MAWKKLDSKEILKTSFFRFSVDRCQTSQGKEMPRYYIMEFPDWVQVLAFNLKGDLILVDQYRYPGQGSFLEFPGGSTHPHFEQKSGEDPLLAAKRELLEETGHKSENWISVGAHYPNPAIMTNRCHVFIAKDCKKVADLDLDPFEELRVVEMPLAQFEKHCRDDLRKHSLMLASLYLAKPYL